MVFRLQFAVPFSPATLEMLTIARSSSVLWTNNRYSVQNSSFSNTNSAFFGQLTWGLKGAHGVRGVLHSEEGAFDVDRHYEVKIGDGGLCLGADREAAPFEDPSIVHEDAAKGTSAGVVSS